MRFTALAILLATSVSFAQTKPAAPAAQTKPAPTAAVSAALKPYQGTWVLTTPDGQPLAPNGDLTITITADKYEQAVAGTVNERGSVKLDATKKPTWVDLTITEGPDAGKLQVGVIEVTGTTMKGALSPAGDTTRPTSVTEGPIVFIAKKK